MSVNPPAVRVSNLTKRYMSGDMPVTAIDDISFEINQRTIVGILGPNGAGKTTLTKMMLGLVIPTGGEVRLMGIDPHSHPAEAYHHASAMLEGARNIYWRLTVRENLEFFSSLVGISPRVAKERHEELLTVLNLVEKADERVNDLSRGMKQKVSLACTLVRNTSVLFLDEPTLGLDVESSIAMRREIRDLVDREGRTVILSSHDMDVIEDLCDRVIILNGGAIVADDSVGNLTDLFRSQAYDIRLEGRVPETLKHHMEREFVIESWETSYNGVTSFEVVLEDGYGLYEIIDHLSTSELGIESIESRQPDLETAFLELTNLTDADSKIAGDGDELS